MSWDGYTPWTVFIAFYNENMARMCCAFTDGIHVSEFRDDYMY